MIEIEMKVNSHRYILGDLYRTVYSDYYRMSKKLFSLDELKGVYVLLTQDINEESSKRLQYRKLVESYGERSDLYVVFKIFWKEEAGVLVQEF